MSTEDIHVVTGAFGYSGKYITTRLLNEGLTVHTLTNSLRRPNPFGAKVKASPFNFANLPMLVASLKGARVLYNTYWVRFNCTDGGGRGGHQRLPPHDPDRGGGRNPCPSPRLEGEDGGRGPNRRVTHSPSPTSTPRVAPSVRGAVACLAWNCSAFSWSGCIRLVQFCQSQRPIASWILPSEASPLGACVPSCQPAPKPALLRSLGLIPRR